MKIKDFMRTYDDDGATFFICTEGWLDTSAGVEQAMDISLEALLDEWGEEEILKFTVVENSIGFLIR